MEKLKRAAQAYNEAMRLLEEAVAEELLRPGQWKVASEGDNLVTVAAGKIFRSDRPGRKGYSVENLTEQARLLLARPE